MSAFVIAGLLLAITTIAVVSLYIWPEEYEESSGKEVVAPLGGSEVEYSSSTEESGFTTVANNSSGPEDGKIELGFPEGVPHRGWLQKGGVETMSELLAIEDFTTIQHIGPERASDLEKYVDENVHTL